MTSENHTPWLCILTFWLCILHYLAVYTILPDSVQHCTLHCLVFQIALPVNKHMYVVSGYTTTIYYTTVVPERQYMYNFVHVHCTRL